jgi:hypothetical protein
MIVASLFLIAPKAQGQQQVYRAGVLANMWFPELRQA